MEACTDQVTEVRLPHSPVWTTPDDESNPYRDFGENSVRHRNVARWLNTSTFKLVRLVGTIFLLFVAMLTTIDTIADREGVLQSVQEFSCFFLLAAESTMGYMAYRSRYFYGRDVNHRLVIRWNLVALVVLVADVLGRMVINWGGIQGSFDVGYIHFLLTLRLLDPLMYPDIWRRYFCDGALSSAVTRLEQVDWDNAESLDSMLQVLKKEVGWYSRCSYCSRVHLVDQCGVTRVIEYASCRLQRLQFLQQQPTVQVHLKSIDGTTRDLTLHREMTTSEAKHATQLPLVEGDTVQLISCLSRWGKLISGEMAVIQTVDVAEDSEDRHRLLLRPVTDAEEGEELVLTSGLVTCGASQVSRCVEWIFGGQEMKDSDLLHELEEGAVIIEAPSQPEPARA